MASRAARARRPRRLPWAQVRGPQLRLRPRTGRQPPGRPVHRQRRLLRAAGPGGRTRRRRAGRHRARRRRIRLRAGRPGARARARSGRPRRLPHRLQLTKSTSIRTPSGSSERPPPAAAQRARAARWPSNTASNVPRGAVASPMVRTDNPRARTCSSSAFSDLAARHHHDRVRGEGPDVLAGVHVVDLDRAAADAPDEVVDDDLDPGLEEPGQDPVVVDVRDRLHPDHGPPGHQPYRRNPALPELDRGEGGDGVGDVIDDHHFAPRDGRAGQNGIPAHAAAGLPAGATPPRSTP